MGLISGYDEEFFHKVDIDLVPCYDTVKIVRERENKHLLDVLCRVTGRTEYGVYKKSHLMCQTCNIVKGSVMCVRPCIFVRSPFVLGDAIE